MLFYSFNTLYPTGVSVIEVIVSQIVAYSIIGFLQTVLVVISGVYIVGVRMTFSVLRTMLNCSYKFLRVYISLVLQILPHFAMRTNGFYDNCMQK